MTYRSYRRLHKERIGDETFMQNSIRKNEYWIYGYNIEINVQSSLRVGKKLICPKKTQQSQANVKIMLTVFFFAS